MCNQNVYSSPGRTYWLTSASWRISGCTSGSAFTGTPPVSATGPRFFILPVLVLWTHPIPPAVPPPLPRSFNILSSKKPIRSFQTSAFTPDGVPPLSASCFEGPPYVFLRQLTSSSPTCSLFPPGDSSHLCPSLWQLVSLALKSTPDDFFSSAPPLSTYKPLQEVSLSTDPPHFLPLSPCASLPGYPHPESMHSPPLSCSSLPPSLFPLANTSLSFSFSFSSPLQALKCLVRRSLTFTDPPVFPTLSLHQAPLAVSPQGRRGQLFWLVDGQALPLSFGFASAPLALFFLLTGEWLDRAPFTHVIPLDSPTFCEHTVVLIPLLPPLSFARRKRGLFNHLLAPGFCSSRVQKYK